MELIQAYKLYLNKLQEHSPTFNKITSDQDCMFLSSLFLLKSYKNYILLLTENKKSPRITKIKDLTYKEVIALEDLIESCIIYIDSLQLNPKNILLQDDEIVDPYNIINIVLNDHITSALSDDSVYETIAKSVFNIVVEDDFEYLLKQLFLKFAHSKQKYNKHNK